MDRMLREAGQRLRDESVDDHPFVPEERVHLHHDDCPQALAILGALLGHRDERAQAIGYEQTEDGAWVDWASLTASWLSTTEVAAVHIARGVAIAERHGGGLPWSVAGHVEIAIRSLT